MLRCSHTCTGTRGYTEHNRHALSSLSWPHYQTPKPSFLHRHLHPMAPNHPSTRDSPTPQRTGNPAARKVPLGMSTALRRRTRGLRPKSTPATDMPASPPPRWKQEEELSGPSFSGGGRKRFIPRMSCWPRNLPPLLVAMQAHLFPGFPDLFVSRLSLYLP